MFTTFMIEEEAFRLSVPELIAGHAAKEPDICLLPSGTGVIVWSETTDAGDVIRLGVVSPETGETKIYDCSTEIGVEFQPVVAHIGNEHVLIAWIAYRDETWQLLTRIYYGGEFSPETLVASSKEGIMHPALYVDYDQNCRVAYEHIHNQCSRIFFNKYRDGAWEEAIPVSETGMNAYRPAIAQRTDGAVFVAWDVYRDGSYDVHLKQVDPLAETVQVTDDGYQNLQADITADSDNNIWIAWASNKNEAERQPWWLTSWVYLQRYDGEKLSEPLGWQPDVDIYSEDSVQGWEFPSVTTDAAGRVWVFGQSSHTLYGQYYAGNEWSPLYCISQTKWGSWKPRVRVAGKDPIYIVTMGLDGMRLQRLEIDNSPMLIPATGKSSIAFPAKPTATMRETRTITTRNNEELGVFFGDLHAHSVYSDATNDVDQFYHRYRDGYGYDFACLTDHDYLDDIELSPSELAMIWNHADRITTPGQFVAMYGYEWTSPAIAEHAAPGRSVGEGHRHIIYPDKTGPLISYGDEAASSGKKLLAQLADTDAIVISHHTSWSGTDLDAFDARLQPVAEICSAHGRFEYPGNKPIGYRRDHIHVNKFIQDMLDRGYRIGFVGGSDSHGLKWHGTEMADRDSHIPPGTRIGWKQDAYRTGMTAILAPELTRESLYGALKKRRCYATSGVFIHVDFRINGALMGEEIESNGQPAISAKAIGTAPIRALEVVRSGHVFGGLQCQPGEGITELSFAMKDSIMIPGESHHYYLRVTQEDGNMAWSSPIWVTYVK